MLIGYSVPFSVTSPKNLSGHMSDRGHMCGRARPLASHTRGRFGKSYQSSCQHKEFVGGAQAPYLRVPLADGTLVATPELSRDAIARKPITGIVGCCARAASGRRAAEQRDELAPFHSITSSTLASSCCGTSRPSALAVCRLMANSNLVDCNTGSSAGLAPLMMLPV